MKQAKSSSRAKKRAAKAGRRASVSRSRRPVKVKGVPGSKASGRPFIDSSKLSIIIAAYNEEKNITATIARVVKVVPKAEIIVVNDGSRDNTAAVVRQAQKKFKQVKLITDDINRGKGYAILQGVNAASRPYQAQVDADSQFQPEELPELVAPVMDGACDITFATRFRPGAKVDRGSLTGIRRLANWTVSGLTSVLCGQRLTDVNAGFKAWTTKGIQKVDFRCWHFAYEPEIAILANKRGLRIKEIPIHYTGRQGGITSVKLIRDGVIIPLFLFKTKLFR
ncbi:hypothetical protein COY28_04120 [Candidatus Woesearchaeota archaeon CG_4_10_14_0_2_um_filter_57_5]|nr:MAG: hypothetical protein AUJ68_06065 [Candidatus Woesearchaeota archaeon CG1_02_57_44]PIN68026.1 MAG: hypothetical protein COV94_06235 [Candidatus Woesearchaeota archaeon CG11_big_fil_rev_8_21_14_0_20_57_5]PIZ52849.1 MAG: hypothetical protein COY28_04120 [Candidatus Woesearchaeota archaeon CG_4_10_14_0_2_um_filter_57_5]